MSEQPQRDMPAINALKLRIAEELGETARPVLSKIWYIIYLKGLDFAEDLLRETHAIEAAGGMFLEREQRRRTPGGVFFQLVKDRVTGRERHLIFEARKQKQQGGKRAPRPPGATIWAGPARDRAVDRWSAAGSVASADTGLWKGKHCEDNRDWSACPDRLAIATEGLPAPPAQTKYLVLLAKKQWTTVAEAIQAEDDALIVEGYPAYESRHAGITVYTLSVMTK